MVVLADYRDGAGHILVDDGSCVAEITLTPKEAEGQPWREGLFLCSWRPLFFCWKIVKMHI